MNIIEVKNVSKTYHTKKTSVKALNNISFSVKEGTIFGFIGPNGAGKSTTISILLQFLYQDEGTVKLFGQEVTKENISNLKRSIGFIPDADLPSMPALTLLKHTARHYGYSGKKLIEKIKEVVLLTDSKAFIGRNTKNLSKGQKTKVKIANALLGDPKLLIADEPTSGLDPIARKKFLQIIKNLADHGTTIFFSNHVIGEIEKICDEALIIINGEIVTEGRIKDIIGATQIPNTYIVEVSGITQEKLVSLPNIVKVEHRFGNEFFIQTSNSNGSTPEFIKEIVNNSNYSLESFSKSSTDLEDIFIDLVNNSTQEVAT